LPLRKVGKELGADPAAVYRRFADMNELPLALADRVFAAAGELHAETTSAGSRECPRLPADFGESAVV
jgi:AcrR family transcriptional regulator